MDANLRDRVRELLEAGGGEPLEGGRFLPLVTLESGARVGLDSAGAWVFAPDGGAAQVFAPGRGQVFFEVLESRRDDFDAGIEAAARAAGLPAEEVAYSFPATDVVRAVLAKGLPTMTRLALSWLRLTEVRALRAEIAAVSRDPTMPAAIRDLAERLTVPE
ncbi:hypothetical protein SOCEGT47_032420 [Sorangium cellulosum]|uniref:Uncharacterized protein n=1 Tax=Sorangium cellulosum TaxID=56 RepID=A0A4P2Q0L3_SORCE|nr:hypothetical protein [Sorangium cellulosum]AUX22735.1 hypothetical protein SOCEGT47_032420 [Sorangium cellulosum]